MKALLRAPNGERDSVPWDRWRSEGFSLTELMVVIAIIAIMAALLMPALSKGKQQATAAACLNNQKQLAAAFHMYTQDNSDRILQMADYMTGETFYPAGGFWGGPTSGPGWPSAAAAIVAAQSGLRSSNALYYYCNNVGVYHCPADPRIARNPATNNPNGWAYDSYARTQNLGGEPFDNYWGRAYHVHQNVRYFSARRDFLLRRGRGLARLQRWNLGCQLDGEAWFQVAGTSGDMARKRLLGRLCR